MPLQGKVDFLLADAPYNIRHEAWSSAFSYDVFSKQYIDDMPDLAVVTIRPG